MLMTTLLTVIKTEWFVERHQIPEKSQESGSGNKPLPPSLYSFRVQIYKTKILTTNWSRNISQTIFPQIVQFGEKIKKIVWAQTFSPNLTLVSHLLSLYCCIFKYYPPWVGGESSCSDHQFPSISCSANL